jgi:hypothetical protein
MTCCERCVELANRLEAANKALADAEAEIAELKAALADDPS